MTLNKQHLTACLLFSMFPHMNSISSDLFQSFWGFFNVNVQSVSMMSLSFCRSSFHESLRQIGSVQNQGNQAAMGTYETMQHFSDIKEHLHTVKRDVEHLVQRNAQVWIGVWTLLICFTTKKSVDWTRWSALCCLESSWQGPEVSRVASHAFLLIHCSFCNLCRGPVSPILLLRHVQVRYQVVIWVASAWKSNHSSNFFASFSLFLLQKSTRSSS